MKVKSWMIKKVVNISKGATVQEALKLMKKHSIRHLPVIEENDKSSMVGLVTEGGLRQFFFLSMVEKISVQDAMVINPITIEPHANVELAASLIHRHKIGCLPVVEKKKLVGIITTTDILAAFIEMMGLLNASSRIDLELKGEEGSIEEISRIVKENDSEIISIGIVNQSSRKKLQYIRLQKCDPEPIVKSLERHGYKVVSVMR
ncbi:MAG: CBS and ACT domain-containing protein [Thermodesulfobacteriota bacterium]|nr:CBS and ACT domain-containing protein [Thermodesulfobacteriota bacterium]